MVYDIRACTDARAYTHTTSKPKIVPLIETFSNEIVMAFNLTYPHALMKFLLIEYAAPFVFSFVGPKSILAVTLIGPGWAYLPNPISIQYLNYSDQDKYFKPFFCKFVIRSLN